MTGRHPIADRIAHRLFGHAEGVANDDGELAPYIRRYLPEHVGDAGIWDRLGDRIEVLDRLNPDAVASEAMRVQRGPATLPAPVIITMVAHNELRSASAEQRQLTRALTASRLGFRDPALTDPSLRWSCLKKMVPHLPLTGHTGRVTAVAFTTLPEGRTLLASASWDKTVRMWDPVTATQIGPPLIGHTRFVTDVAFGALPDGRVLLASASEDGTVRSWDAVTGNPLGEPLIADGGSPINAVAFGTLPDGRVLMASASNHWSVQLWDPVTHAPVGGSLAGHTGPVTALAFAKLPDGRVVLASGGGGIGPLRLWDPSTGSLLAETMIRRTVAGVIDMAFGALPDKRLLLATAVEDGRLRLWDLNSGTFRDHVHSITSRRQSARVAGVAFGELPDGRVLLAAVGDDDYGRRQDNYGTVRLWDVVSDIPFANLTGHPERVSAVAFGKLSEGRVLLATGDHRGAVHVWDPMQSVGGHTADDPLSEDSRVASLAFGAFPDGRMLLASVGSWNRPVRLWDANSGSLVRTIGRTKWVSAVAFGVLPDGRVLLASDGDPDGRVVMWDVSSGEIVGKPLNREKRAVQSLAFSAASPDGRLFLAMVEKLDGSVWLWDALAGTLVSKRRHTYPGRVVAFGVVSDGRVLLATADKRGTVRVWDALAGTLVSKRRHAHPVHVTALGVSDGRLLLATAEADGPVWSSNTRWRLSVGEVVSDIPRVRSLTFGVLPDGRTLLASASDDGTVRLWDPGVRSESAVLCTYSVSPSTPLTLCFGLTNLYVGCDDGLIALDITYDPLN
jgi:WD40 repeat protein